MGRLPKEVDKGNLNCCKGLRRLISTVNHEFYLGVYSRQIVNRNVNPTILIRVDIRMRFKPILLESVQNLMDPFYCVISGQMSLLSGRREVRRQCTSRRRQQG